MPHGTCWPSSPINRPLYIVLYGNKRIPNKYSAFQGVGWTDGDHHPSAPPVSSEEAKRSKSIDETPISDRDTGFTSFKFGVRHIAFGSQGTVIYTSSPRNLFRLHVTCKICMLNIPAHFAIAKLSTPMLFRVDFEVLGFEVKYWTRLADGDWKHGDHNWLCFSSLPNLFHLHVICTIFFVRLPCCFFAIANFSLLYCCLQWGSKNMDGRGLHLLTLNYRLAQFRDWVELEVLGLCDSFLGFEVKY